MAASAWPLVCISAPTQPPIQLHHGTADESVPVEYSDAVVAQHYSGQRIAVRRALSRLGSFTGVIVPCVVLDQEMEGRHVLVDCGEPRLWFVEPVVGPVVVNRGDFPE